MRERTILRIAMTKKFGNSKKAACFLGYSPEMMSRVLNGERNIAPDLMPKIAKANITAGMAIAEETTGYRCFQRIEGDRHPQTMIRRVEKEDAEADAVLRQIPWVIIDKQCPEDLSEEEREVVCLAGKEIADRIRADLNLLETLDDFFQLGLVDHLVQQIQERKRPLVTAAR
jgi:hypothetical protein